MYAYKEFARKYANEYRDEQFRVQGMEVKKFHASLFMLRSRCIDSDDKRHTSVPGYTAKRENYTSDVGCQVTVYLRHDQYEALGEILTELPYAMDKYRDGLISSGIRYTAQFPRTSTAEKYTAQFPLTSMAQNCNSTTTWSGRWRLSYGWLLNICDSGSGGLEYLLIGAEALLSLLCESVPNFEVLWLRCLHALGDLCLTPMTENLIVDRSSQRSLLHNWIKSLENRVPDIWPDGSHAFWNPSRTSETCPATCMKGTIRLLRLHLVSSLFSKNGTQPYSYHGGRVGATDRPRTNMVSKRKQLPMIIGGKEIKAQHDSGAERTNFIDYDLASQLSLRLRNKKGDCKRFCMGNGKIVKALGRVKAICAFAKEAQTKMECWFYVFDKLASPLIMGSQFLEKTKTLSDHVHRLEDCIPSPGTLPMVNLIGSTQHAKRRFTAHIDHRLTLINADTGSDLDLMSSTYVRAHGYQLDRRRRCRKRVRFADKTVAETIGQVQATLTLGDGSTYLKVFDVLPNLTSEVLLGQFTLQEINAFTSHRDSFVDVFAGERHLELSVLVDLGKVSEFLARKLKSAHGRKGQMQKQGKSPQYDLKRLEIATNSWISIACETTG